MGKATKITLGVIVGLIAFAYLSFLFLVPALVNANSFKPQIEEEIAKATGLKAKLGDIKIKTSYDLCVEAAIDNTAVNYSDGNKLLSLKDASVKIALSPLVFKKLEVVEVKLDKPEIYITREKSGKYDIETKIEIPEAPQAETEAEPQEPPVALEFEGFNLVVTDYKLNLTDKRTAPPKQYVLKGGLLKIADFTPDKFVKLVTKGAFLINGEPKVNFDIAIASELPLVKLPETEFDAELDIEQRAVAAQPVDPLDNILKYNLKGDIAADLTLKEDGSIPKIDGSFSFDKLSFRVDNQQLPDSYGHFQFAGKKVDIDSKLFITPESYVSVAGKVKNIKKQDFDIDVKSTPIKLSDVKKFVYSLANAVNADTTALDDVSLAGSLQADFNLKKDDYSGFLNILNTKIAHKGLSKPLDKINSVLKFDGEKITLEQTSGTLGDIVFNATGYITSKPYADIKVDVPVINMKTIVDIVNNSKLLAELKPQIADFKNVSGYVNAQALVKGKLDEDINPQVIIGLNNIYAYSVSAQMPIAVTSGQIIADAKKANINNIKVKVFQSPFVISGEITELANIPELDVKVNGKILANDIKNYFPPEAQKQFASMGDIPVLATLEGSAEDIDVVAQTNIDTLSTVVKFNQLAGTSNILSLNANLTPKTLKISETGLFSGTNIEKNKNGLYKLGSAKELISVKGDVKYLNSAMPYIDDVTVDVKKLDLTLIEPKGQVQVNGNLVVKGKVEAPKAIGALVVKNVDLPSMFFKADKIDVALKEDEILVDTGLFTLTDAKLKTVMTIQNKLTPPFVVKNMDINADFINLDKLMTAFPPPQPIKYKSLKDEVKALHSIPDVPVIVQNGKFFAKQLVTTNLLNKDVAFNFMINPINMFKMREFITHIGAGNATGIVDMNLKTTKLSLDMIADNIEINALASTFGQMPNEIFGGMKGKIKLTTIGQTPESQTANAVGRVDFTIDNGHLPKLGSLSYLLRAKNMSSKGITDALLNKTLQFDEVEQTNHFDHMQGLVMINRGIMDIQSIEMQGKHMSSYINGKIRMIDNYADLTVLGKVSGVVTRKLGVVAEVSVDALLRKIPGGWGQMLANQRVENQYPNRSRIPALNSPPSEGDKDFAVKIKGSLQKPNTVKMFEWLNQPMQ